MFEQSRAITAANIVILGARAVKAVLDKKEARGNFIIN